MVEKISEGMFDASVKEGYSVIDFSATWCQPCKMLAPVLEEVSEEFNGKVKFFNVDVDEAPNLCTKLGIMGVPAVFVFKNGEKVNLSVGFQGKDQLKQFIESSMN